jgi:hypothetical protein
MELRVSDIEKLVLDWPIFERRTTTSEKRIISRSNLVPIEHDFSRHQKKMANR